MQRDYVHYHYKLHHSVENFLFTISDGAWYAKNTSSFTTTVQIYYVPMGGCFGLASRPRYQYTKYDFRLNMSIGVLHGWDVSLTRQITCNGMSHTHAKKYTILSLYALASFHGEYSVLYFSPLTLLQSKR